MTPLLPDDTFQFSCRIGLSCFNSCCRDLNQFLTPFDILTLKNHLGVSSADFLARYTTWHTGPASGLPIVSLKPVSGSLGKCPFVTATGCKVYAGRPSSCRMYPLVRAIGRCRKTGALREQYMLLKESHCRGFDQDDCQTVREWIASQQLAKHNQINDMLMEIIRLKNLSRPGPLENKSRHVFYLALYDLDTFKSKIMDTGGLDNYPLGPDQLDTIKDDDIALLEISHSWVKQILFGKNRIYLSAVDLCGSSQNRNPGPLAPEPSTTRRDN